VNLGDKVSFIRADEKGNIIEGCGVVVARYMRDGRELVQVKGVESSHNVFLACVNPSDEFKAAFTAGMIQVQQLTDEGNAKVRELVADYNERVEVVYDGLLGARMEGFNDVCATPERTSSGDN